MSFLSSQSHDALLFFLGKEEGMAKEQAETCLSHYEAWMDLVKNKEDDESIDKDSDIAKAWELHILDTGNYLKDCLRFFGGYLHRRSTESGQRLRGVAKEYRFDQNRTRVLDMEDFENRVMSLFVEEDRGMVREYSRYLYLFAYSRKSRQFMVPSKKVDVLWHRHMLETERDMWKTAECSLEDICTIRGRREMEKRREKS